MSEARIICEGYHDRAFWAGLLNYIGCKSPARKPDGTMEEVKDPTGEKVSRGHFAFWSAKGGFIRVVPANGKHKVFPAMRDGLLGLSRRSLRHLVVGVDEDVAANAASLEAAALTEEKIEAVAAELGLSPKRDAAGSIEVGSRPTTIHLLRWRAKDQNIPGLPDKQTLERLICAAIAAARPNWAPPVHEWLGSRPDKPSPCPKEHAWSYLAGWFADSGSYEAFLGQRIWADSAIANELINRPRETGILRVAEMIANWS